MKKHIGKDIIPLLIAIILILSSIGIVLFTDYVLNSNHYAGILLILISTILYFKNKKWFVYIFGLTLILGVFNLIVIYYATVSFGIGSIRFNPIFLTLFVIFLALNRQLLDQMFPDRKPKEVNLAEQIKEKEKRIKSYERKFQSKSESELVRIADENSGYVEEAKIASKNILRIKYVL
jgi:signal transduction histidine kinase